MTTNATATAPDIHVVPPQPAIEATIRAIYGDIPIAPCPFTVREIDELERANEMLIYLPARVSMTHLSDLLGVRANVHFENEGRMIRNCMVDEDQWFVTSASRTPELIYESGVAARRVYEDEGLHGMDVRRYLAFCLFFKQRHGVIPDATYWTFLLSGSYDRSGVSIIGFDAAGVLSHHGWMKNFKAKFVGSRYVVIAPRIEISPETVSVPRARRGGGRGGREADMDRS